MEKRGLANIANIVTGSSPAKAVAKELVPFIQIKDLDPSKRALVAGAKPTARRAMAARPGDVLLAARGGQAVVVGQGAGDGLAGGFPTLDVYLIRPDIKRLDPAYLAARLMLEHVRQSLQASTTGALIPRIPIAALKGLPIPLPPLARQRAIGALFHLARAEADLMDRLTTLTRHLREQQVAAAFASLEPHTP